MITLKLDKRGGINKGDVQAFEHDNLSEVYIIQLYKNGEVYSLANKTVELIMLERKRKLGDIFDLPIYEATEGKVKLGIVTELTKQDGLYDFQITVKDTTGLIETFPHFQIDIKRDLVDDIAGGIIEDPNFTILSEGLKSLSEYNVYKENALKVGTIEQDLKNYKTENEGKIEEFASQLDTIARDLDTSRTLNHINNGTFQINDTNYKVPVDSEWIGLGGTIITGGTKNLTWENKQYVILKNITFENIRGLSMNDCDYIYIENCTFRNCSKVGLFTSNTKEIHIKNCSFSNIGASVTNSERVYLGGALYGNGGGKLIFENNFCENIKGQGAIQLVEFDEIYVVHNYFNKMDMRAFSNTTSVKIPNGCISYNTIENCGTYNTDPVDGGVGCNAIYSKGVTNLSVNYNTIKNVVENGIEINCLEIVGNTIENTGLLQDTMPTPSTEGIWGSTKKIINNTIINARLEGIRVTNPESPTPDRVITGNTIIKGPNSTVDNAIGWYGKGLSNSIISNNVSMGYPYLFYASESSQGEGKVLFNNNASDGGLLNGHFENFHFNEGLDLLPNPSLSVESDLTKCDLKLNNISFVREEDGLVFTGTNEYDGFVYKDIESSNLSNIVVSVDVLMKTLDNFAIRIVPYNEKNQLDYSKCVIKTYVSNSEFQEGYLAGVLKPCSRFRVEAKTGKNSKTKEFTLKYLKIKVM